MIQRKSLAQEVAENIEQQIASGMYNTGDKLPVETDLMKAFGVGRSTIREAIKSLAISGLVVVKQGIGTFVEEKNLTQESLDMRLKRANYKELDEVRQVLEMKIAESAALNRTDADIQNIEKNLQDRKKYAEMGVLESCIAADIQFHIAIAESSKNVILLDLYKCIAVHLTNRFFYFYKDTAAFINSQNLHEKLFKSIVQKDAKKAWQTAAKIIGHVSQ